MLLKKIVDLISYNQIINASKPCEDIASECSEHSMSDSIEDISNGVHSSLSITERFSVQGFCSTPQCSFANKTPCLAETNGISDLEFQECSPFETINEVERLPEAEAKTSGYRSVIERKGLAHDLSLPSNETPPEIFCNATSDFSSRRDNFAQTEAQVIPSDSDFLKDSFSQTEAQLIPPCSDFLRDSFAQTETQVLDKKCRLPLVAYKHASDETIIAPSDIDCRRNSSTQTKALAESINAASNCRFAQTVAQIVDKKRQLSVATHKRVADDSIIEPNRKYNCYAEFTTKSNNTGYFSSAENQNSSLDTVVYGTLFVFGCNGGVPPHLVGKMKSKYVLRKRVFGNGLKEAFCYIRPAKEPVSISPAKHVISYPVSSNTCIDVAFKSDPSKDMFQIGRHDELPIDFTVDDLNPSDISRHGVSRYACRIIVCRDGGHEARIYAAAFDSSQTIFLGEESIPCTYRGKMDGFTTNGVLIMKPRGNQPGAWREVSVGGNIYPVRHFSKVEASKRPRMIDESNILEDGTLIDLCGLTLLWRTPDGLKNTPDGEYLFRLQSDWHKSVPESLLLSQTLIVKAKSAAKKAYVFLSCGHVVGLTLPKEPKNLQGWSCPVCRVISHIAELKIGAEPGFHLNKDFPTFVFKPCGHVASKRTVEYWSCVKIPLHRSFKDSVCPFCGVKLNTIKKYVKLLHVN